jgi:hypothetical protein
VEKAGVAGCPLSSVTLQQATCLLTPSGLLYVLDTDGITIRYSGKGLEKNSLQGHEEIRQMEYRAYLRKF